MIEQERLIAAPYPGLRPFDTNENFVFFGRDGQSDEVLSKLRAAKFVAVVGTSGSGKSSLVRAGLLPALLSGHMTSAGSKWRIAIFRPGNSPIKNLAEALNAPDVFGTTEAGQATLRLSNIERTLRRSSLGLLEVVSQSRMKKEENLLILADQFEELFRFKHGRDEVRPEDEAAAFVKLLLEARQTGKDDENRLPIYIILTMRSDYLGDCANFWGLPEAINDGQYLIPRMTDDDRREAITGPAIIGGGDISSPLVNRLLNDAGEDPARLPILQHALMRTWEYWKSLGNNEAPIDLVHYEKIGTMAQALSIHADEAFYELSPPLQKIAEKLFKALTEKEDDRRVRRPATVAEIAGSAEATEDDVKKVIETFRREGRSFLMPPPTVELQSDTLIDISHESLIGGWDKLKAWVEEEAQAAWQYRRLAQSAALFPDHEGHLRGPALQMSLKWRKEHKPTKAWATRYDPNFDKSIQYLEESKTTLDAEIAEQERKRKEENEKDVRHAEAIAAQEKRRATLLRRGLIVLAALFLGMVATTIVAVKQKANAQAQQKIAQDERVKAVDAKDDANLQRERAENYARELQKTLSDLQEAKESTDEALIVARRERDNAEAQKAAAEVATAKALKAETAARIAEQTATTAQAKTEETLQALRQSQAERELAQKQTQEQLKLVREIDSSAPYYKAIMRGHDKGVSRVAFSPDGKLLLTSDGLGSGFVWDQATGQPYASQLPGTTHTSPVVISPGGQYALEAGNDSDGPGRIFDRRLQKVVGEIKGWNRTTIDKSVFSADEQLVVSHNLDRKCITVAELATGNIKHHLGDGTFSSVQSYALSPDGKRVATARTESYAQLWDVATGKPLAELRHLGPVYSVVFSPDSKFVVTTSKDGTASIWDATSGSPLTRLAGHAGAVNSVMFDATGNYLVTTSEKVAYLWKAKVKGNWTEVSADSPHTIKGHTEFVTQALFSPDGKWVATISGDRTAQLWDAKILESDYADDKPPRAINVAVFRGHIKPLTSAAFSPDSKYLTTGSEDRTARVWDLTSVGALTVGVVGLNVDRPRYTGPCPVTLKFSATISVSGRSSKIKYRFRYNNGYTGDKELVFETSGTAEVSDTRDVYQGVSRSGRPLPTSGWVEVEILEPVTLTSLREDFNVTCTDSTSLQPDKALTPEQLREIIPNASEQNRALYLPHIQKAMDEFGINTPLRRAAFLSAVAIHSVNLTVMEQKGSEEFFQRYEGRKDLGNVEPGDGARFKGRGPFSITGRTNYKSLGDALGVDLIKEPQLAASPELAFRIAAFTWVRGGLNELADSVNLVAIYQRVIGVPDPQAVQNFKEYFDRAKVVLSR